MYSSWDKIRPKLASDRKHLNGGRCLTCNSLGCGSLLVTVGLPEMICYHAAKEWGDLEGLQKLVLHVYFVGDVGGRSDGIEQLQPRWEKGVDRG
jgi:hypothetical protein